MKKQIIVFNGVHGAGKSTMAQALATQDDRFVLYPEVGRQIREEVTYNALESGEEFDREVMRREIGRDALLVKAQKVPLIETWHMGNIGYIEARTPHLTAEYTELLRKQLELFDPICVFVHIDWDLFRKRVTEKIRPSQMEELIAFYQIIKDTTFKLYDQLGLGHHIIENQGDLHDGMVILKERINERLVG
jgi:deoxyadenosine/deoxycytidine kinase